MMKIASFTLNPYRSNNQSTCSFGNRITRTMQSKPLISEAAIDQLLLERDEIIGELPKDFIALYKKNHDTNINYKKFIENVRGVFSEVSDACEEYEKIKASKAPDLSKITPVAYFASCKKSIDNFMTGNFSNDKSLFEYINPKLDENTSKKINKILQERFADIGLIDKKDKIQVKFLGQGDFGYTFKISGADKYGNKLFSDKVFKYYKDKKQQIEKFVAITSLRYKMLNSGEESNKLVEYTAEKAKQHPQFNFLTEAWIKDMKECQQCTSEEYVGKFREKLKEIYNYNGLVRESNAALFLKKNAGQKLNAAEFYFADRKKNYMLTEFIPDNKDSKPITPAEIEHKKELFRVFGLEFSDINPSNFVSGKLIDYGEFHIGNPILANSAVSRRYYKKIKHINISDEDKKTQEQIKHLNYYYSLASSNKLPSADEVIAGLTEAKELIPKEYWKLIIF